MEVLNAPLYLGFDASFSVTTGTRARILVPPTPPMVMPAVSGELAEPYDAASRYGHVRQRVLLGGSRIMSGLIGSTDGAAKSLLFYLGTHVATLTGGNDTITSQNVLTLVGGEWSPLTGAGGVNQFDAMENRIQVGDFLMLFRSDADADNMGPNDGVLAGPVTAVGASSAAVNGTPWTNDAAIDAGCQVFRVVQQTRKGIPANSGNADATVPVNLLGGTQETDLPSQPDLGRQIGMHNAWIAGLAAAASALPAAVQIGGTYARY